MYARPRRRLASLAAFLAFLALAPLASAQLIAVEQSRFVRTMVNASQCGGQFQFDTREAPDFRPFTAILESQHACEGGAAHATAGQRSAMTSSMLRAVGGGRVAGLGPNFGIVHSFAHSTVDLTFDVPALTTVSLEGLFTAARSPNVIEARTSLTITPLNAQPVFSRALEADGPRRTERFAERLTLQPGRYRLYLTADIIMDNTVPPDAAADAAYLLNLNVVRN